jgi:hypothetical protein
MNIFEWCETEYSQDDQFLVLDLEKYFHKRCEEFLVSRREHGFSESTYHPSKAPVVEIIDTDRFYAMARIDPETELDHLGVSWGALNFLLWLSMKVAAVIELPFLDAAQAQPLKRRTKLSRSTESLADSYDIPSSPLRRAFGVEIAFLAFLFIVFHELGHLAQNHLRIKQKSVCFDFEDEDDENLIETSSAAYVDAKECAQWQALEFSADLFAFRELLVFIKSVRDEVFPGEHPWNAVRPSVRPQVHCYADEAWTAFIAYLALSITFHLTSDGSVKHPAKAVRLLSTLLASKSLVQPILGGHHGVDLALTGTVGLEEVARVFKQIVPAGMQHQHIVSLLAEDGGQKVQEQIDIYREALLELEPRLREWPCAPKAFLKWI